jgi:hypothetical protein
LDGGGTKCLQYPVRIGDKGEDNGEAFDDALLKYYEERNNKKRNRVHVEDRGARRKLEICDDLAGLVDEAMESDPLPSVDEEIGSMEAA